MKTTPTLLGQPEFWAFAVAALGLVALLTFSLLRAGRTGAATAGAPGSAGAAGDGPAPAAQPLALALGVPLVALALYAGLGQPRALDPGERETGSVAQVEGMVERLAARLRRDPADVEGWLMLAHSYKVMGRVAEAAEAFEQADRAAPEPAAGAAAGASAAPITGPAGLLAQGADGSATPWQRDPNRLVDWIEVRMLAAGDHFDARSRALLQRARALAPQHPGVLMLAGLAALDQGDVAAAREAFTALRDQSAPGSPDRVTLEHALASLAQGLDPRAAAPAPPGAAGSAPPR